MKSRRYTIDKALVRVFIGAAFMATVLFGFSNPARAKGPESVTITGPGIDRPIELLNSADHDLVVQLMEQMGLWYDPGDRLLQGKPAGKLGPGYRLTWINSGPPAKPVAERTIRQVIYFDAESGPVFYTPSQEGLQGWGSVVIGWFSAPPGLQDTLIELGAPMAVASSSNQAALSEMTPSTTQPEDNPGRALWYLRTMILALIIGLAGVLGVYRISRYPYRNTGYL